MLMAKKGKLPDFLFIGAMKAATTTMSFQLGKQPGIYMVSNPKELYYFSYDKNFAKGSDWYRSKFSAAKPNDLCGEAATTYTQLPHSPHVVDRMYELIPNAKLIYIMRHPVDRLVSHFLHEYLLRNITIDINQAIHDYPQLIDSSLYSMQLKPFLTKYGPEQILPMFFERLLQFPQDELERVCRFIGYTGKPQWDFNTAPRNKTSSRPIMYPWIRFMRKTPVLNSLRKSLTPEWLQEKMKTLFASNLEKPKINPQNLDYLHQVFNQDLNILGDWFQTELTCHNFKAVTSSSALKWINVGQEMGDAPSVDFLKRTS
ncbi:MAG: sulfotransferase [Cyanobacteria bacterium]|jgi:hypothetical protein|nr:sulfotransferase [Cyanobacteria bacterium GSL.Bin1]